MSENINLIDFSSNFINIVPNTNIFDLSSNYISNANIFDFSSNLIQKKIVKKNKNYFKFKDKGKTVKKLII